MRELCVEIECPNCGHTTTVKVRELVPGRSKPCVHCGTTFEFAGDDGREVQHAVDDFERDLEQLSRKFTIRL